MSKYISKHKNLASIEIVCLKLSGNYVVCCEFNLLSGCSETIGKIKASFLYVLP